MEERSSDCRKKGVDILFLRFLKNMNIYIYIYRYDFYFVNFESIRENY